MAKADVRDQIAAKFVEALEQGIVPWRKPWRGGGMTPHNPVTGTIYKGGNALYLGFMQFANGYTSGEWYTFNNVTQKGGKVVKGQKGTAIYFWQFLEKVNAKTGKKEKIPMVRTFTVFNRDQCEGLPVKPEAERVDVNPIAEAQKIIDGMPNPPKIVVSPDVTQAGYWPSEDVVRMPSIGQFINAESYYATMYHELGHATGAATRLKRDGVMERKGFGSADYSREELIAEITSAFLCAEVGILDKVEANSIAYVQGWASKLKSEPRLILDAANAAQKAADLILGVTPEAKAEPEAE